MINILITGANSYVGTSFAAWLSQWPDKYHIDTISMYGNDWRSRSFAGYDTVFHVAGIAHRTASAAMKDMYFAVNRDLAVWTATKAKTEGVKQFVFMSSMMVYGLGTRGEEQTITRDTVPSPSDIYGQSKLDAETVIEKMEDDNFAVSILRAPIIYGPGCRGNFPKLLKIAGFAIFFPNIPNRRSMIYIDNFCEFVRGAIDSRSGGILFPQDKEYVSTIEVIKEYRKIINKRTLMVPFPKCLSRKLMCFNKFNNAFRSSVYAKEISENNSYQSVDFLTGLKRTATKTK